MIYENQKHVPLSDIQEANLAEARNQNRIEDPAVAEYAAYGVPLDDGNFKGFHPADLKKQGYPDSVAYNHPASSTRVYKRSIEKKIDRQPTPQELLAGGLMTRVTIAGVVPTAHELEDLHERQN